MVGAFDNYEGAEVETDTNVLNEDVRARTSPCGHDVLVEDVPAEDVDGDVLNYVPNKDLMSGTSSTGRSLLGTSSSGHNVPVRDVLVGDVLGRDVLDGDVLDGDVLEWT